MTAEFPDSGRPGAGGSPSPLSRQSLTRLLAALRKQHTGAPTVAPLITRAAHPSLRREVPAVVARAVRVPRAGEASAAASTVGGAVVPTNLSAVLGVGRSSTT